MHNLHLITIEADSPEDACSDVEERINDWGSENNWRTICGCIDEDNEIHIEDDHGRWMPESGTTIKNIEKMIKNWAENFRFKSIIDEALAKFHADEKNLSSQDWWILGEYCRFKSDKVEFDGYEFNIWEAEYRSWQLDENGLTNMISGQHTEGMKKYMVYVDMHS